MPITIQKHCCNICLNEYLSYAEAIACEALGMPIEPIALAEGQEISFQSEDQVGSHWSYCTATGKILYRCIDFARRNDTRQPLHVVMYIVSDAVFMGRERIIHYSPDEGGFVARAEGTYAVGYANHVREHQAKVRSGGY